MFNLEQSIAEWRQQMLAAGIQTPAPLEELECHLREEIERQMKSGLSLNEQEAFKSAVQKVGRAVMLQKEFGKVGEVMPVWARKMNYTASAMGTVLYCALGLIVLFIIPLAGAFLSMGLLLSAWMFLWRYLPVLLRPRARLAVEFLCLMLSGLCAIILLRFFPLGAGTIEELAIAVAWACGVPLMAASAFIFGLEEAAYRRMAMSDL